MSEGRFQMYSKQCHCTLLSSRFAAEPSRKQRSVFRGLKTYASPLFLAMVLCAESLVTVGAESALDAQPAIRARFGREDAEITCVYPDPKRVLLRRTALVYVCACVLQVPGHC